MRKHPFHSYPFPYLTPCKKPSGKSARFFAFLLRVFYSEFFTPSRILGVSIYLGNTKITFPIKFFTPGRRIGAIKNVGDPKMGFIYKYRFYAGKKGRSNKKRR